MSEMDTRFQQLLQSHLCHVVVCLLFLFRPDTGLGETQGPGRAC